MTIKRRLAVVLLISLHSVPLCWAQGTGSSKGSGRMLVAQNARNLPGFVRSPYTNPPRLVDVKGAAPGSTMICPYTQKPFLIPRDFSSDPETAQEEPMAEEPNTRKTPEPPKAPEPPKPVGKIPWGIAIAGRPGFVNSPFAAKHQLVDVAGLPMGMEVKCPYTGKLFRVPKQEEAVPGTKKKRGFLNW